jgi:hypothetical protein
MPEKKERSTVVEPSMGGADTGAATSSGRQPPVSAERVTVNLTPRSVRALNNLVGWTGYTKTDTINRGLQIYEFIQQIMENGGTVHIRQSEGGELERLTFF